MKLTLSNISALIFIFFAMSLSTEAQSGEETPVDLSPVESFEAGPVLYGETLTFFLLDGSQDEWIVFASAGDVITVTMTSNDLDAHLQIIAPDGSEIARNNNGAGGTDARISDLELETDGIYTILARDVRAQSIGEYTLTVEAEIAGDAGGETGDTAPLQEQSIPDTFPDDVVFWETFDNNINGWPLTQNTSMSGFIDWRIENGQFVADQETRSSDVLLLRPGFEAPDRMPVMTEPFELSFELSNVQIEHRNMYFTILPTWNEESDVLLRFVLFAEGSVRARYGEVLQDTTTDFDIFDGGVYTIRIVVTESLNWLYINDELVMVVEGQPISESSFGIALVNGEFGTRPEVQFTLDNMYIRPLTGEEILAASIEPEREPVEEVVVQPADLPQLVQLDRLELDVYMPDTWDISTENNFWLGNYNNPDPANVDPDQIIMSYLPFPLFCGNECYSPDADEQYQINERILDEMTGVMTGVEIDQRVNYIVDDLVMTAVEVTEVGDDGTIGAIIVREWNDSRIFTLIAVAGSPEQWAESRDTIIQIAGGLQETAITELAENRTQVDLSVSPETITRFDEAPDFIMPLPLDLDGTDSAALEAYFDLQDQIGDILNNGDDFFGRVYTGSDMMVMVNERSAADLGTAYHAQIPPGGSDSGGLNLFTSITSGVSTININGRPAAFAEGFFGGQNLFNLLVETEDGSIFQIAAVGLVPGLPITDSMREVIYSIAATIEPR